MYKYIILDGSDFSGKTTLSKALYEKYKLNYEVFLNSEPYNENIIKSNNLKLFQFIKPYLDKRKIYSDEIRQDNYKMEELYSLFLKDRLYNYEMLCELKQHYPNLLIIQDRSFISTLVYQKIINNRLDKLFIDLIYTISNKYDEVINDIDKNKKLYRVKDTTKIIRYHQTFNNSISINEFLKNKLIE